MLQQALQARLPAAAAASNVPSNANKGWLRAEATVGRRRETFGSFLVRHRRLNQRRKIMNDGWTLYRPRLRRKMWIWGFSMVFIIEIPMVR